MGIGARKYTKYSEEDFQNVIVYLLEGSLTMEEVAEKTGVNVWTVRDWCKKYDARNRMKIKDVAGKSKRIDQLEERIAKLEMMVMRLVQSNKQV